MQRINEYRFYELGQKVQGIQNIVAESKFSDVWIALWEARDALKKLKEDAISVRFSLSVVDRVMAAITVIVPLEVQEATKLLGPENTVGWLYYELREALQQFEPVLAAECNALDTYVVSQKRGYATSDLIEHSEVMLPLETRSILNESIMWDVKAAGRCLAFDVPTAAGFHVLRAAEAVMALYYTHLTGKQLPKQNRNWAIYLKKLSEVPRHSVKIHGALDHIRDNYRNPISHPEDTLTEGQAIMLFGLSLSVIELMAEEMRTIPPALTEVEELKALTEIAAQKAVDEPTEDF